MSSLCKHLRWKGFHGGPLTVERVQDVFARNEVPYECLRTAMALGPEGGPVAPECCAEGRGCFVASKRLIRPPTVA
jgi:hypothetical protein